jgi:hypothetical protein
VRPLGRHRIPRDQIDHRFGDVGSVVTDPLEVLRAEEEMGAERDVTRILHHMGQEVAEDGVLQLVKVDVALPHFAGAHFVALRIRVEHVLQEFGRHVVHMLEADDRARNPRLRANLHRAFGDILGKIADPFEVASDADGADQFSQVDRYRLAAHDGHHRHVFDLALKRVEARIGRDDLVSEHGDGVGQRVHGVDHHLLRDATHFGDPAAQRVEFLVVGLNRMVDHGSHFPRPKPLMTLPQLHDFPRARLLDEFSGLKKHIEEFATRGCRSGEQSGSLKSLTTPQSDPRSPPSSAMRLGMRSPVASSKEVQVSVMSGTPKAIGAAPQPSAALSRVYTPILGAL